MSAHTINAPVAVPERITRVMAMLDRAAEAESACPSNEDIAWAIGAQSAHAGSNAIALLEALGLITVQRRHQARRITIVSTGKSTKVVGDAFADFWTAEREAKLREMVAEGRTDPEIAAHFVIGRTAAEYARRRFKLASLYQAKKRGLPANFHEIAPTITMAEAERRWNAAPQTVKDWYKVNNITPAKRSYGGKSAQPNSAQRSFFRPTHSPMTPLPQRDGSEAGRAQLFLQRYGPVLRASTITPNATGWIMFGRRVSESDLLATAYRKGFRAEAMAA